MEPIGKLPYSDVSLAGDEDAEFLGNEETVDAIEDGRDTDRLPPQGGREGVDVAQLRDENLLLLKILPSCLTCFGAARRQGNALLVHVAWGQQVEAG